MLTNKVILVTGGCGLIGKEIVRDIKKKGGIPIMVILVFPLIGKWYLSFRYV